MSDLERYKPSQTPWLGIAIVTALALVALIGLRDILMPFAIGALIAYLGDPMVDRLEIAALDAQVVWRSFLHSS
jgi:predicted PurR-regulated permease PerM